jgi:hypothetical protein
MLLTKEHSMSTASVECRSGEAVIEQLNHDFTKLVQDMQKTANKTQQTFEVICVVKMNGWTLNENSIQKTTENIGRTSMRFGWSGSITSCTMGGGDLVPKLNDSKHVKTQLVATILTSFEKSGVPEIHVRKYNVIHKY